MSGSVVGRAYVTVRAVTRQVEPDIQKGVDQAVRNVETKSGEKLGQRLGTATGKGIQKSRIDKSLQKAINRYDADEHGRDIGTTLGQAIGDSLFKDSLLTRALDSAVSLALPDFESNGSRAGKRFASGFVKASAIGALALPAISQGLTAVSTLSAAATATVSTLGPAIAGSAAVGGAALTTLLTTVGALTLAFKVESAELDRLKSALGPVRDEYREMGLDIQRILFPALEGAAVRFTAAAGDEINEGLNDTARALGQVANGFADLAESADFQRDLGKIMTANAVALRRFGFAGVNTAATLASIGAAARPLTERFSRWTLELSENARAQIQARQASGELREFFQDAGDTTARWGRILGNTGSALFNIFRIGSASGGRLIGRLEDITENFEAWTESVTGQDSILEWFEQAEPVMSAFGRLLGGLGEGLVNATGDTEDFIRTLDGLADALPTIGSAIGALGSVSSTLLAEVLPALGDVTEAGAEVIEALGPGLVLVGNLAVPPLKLVATGLQGVATGLEALPGPMQAVVGGAIALRLALSALGRSNTFGGFVNNATTNLKNLRTEISTTTGAMSRVRVGAGGLIGVLGGPWGVALSAAAVGVGIFAQRQAEARATVDQLTGTLDQQTGAFTDATRATVGHELITSGAVEAAKGFGIATNDLVDAILGEEDAIARVDAALRDHGATFTKDVNGMDNAVAEFNNTLNDIPVVGSIFGEVDQSRAIEFANDLQQLSGKAQQSRDELEILNDVTADTGLKFQKAAGDVRNAISPYATLTDRQRELARATGESASSFTGQSAAAHSAARAIASVNNAAIAGIEAQIGFKQAIADARKELATGRKTLNLNTQAGRDNVSALLDLAKAAGEVKGSAEKQQAALKKARGEILELAKGAAENDKAAERLTNRIIRLNDTYGKVPKNVKTEVDSPSLEQQIDYATTLTGQLNAIDGRVVTYTVQRNGVTLSDTPDGARAGGGWINGPGTTTSDSILYNNYRVSDQEFVVNAKSAAENADLLEAINAGKNVRGGGGNVAPVNVTINNPIPERATQSVTTTVRSALADAGWDIE